jgi:hypothetical membrane protein
MFTTGRIAFIIFFLLVFIGALVYAYRKDLKVNKTHFKGAFWVLLTIIAIFTVLFLLVKLRN